MPQNFPSQLLPLTWWASILNSSNNTLQCDTQSSLRPQGQQGPFVIPLLTCRYLGTPTPRRLIMTRSRLVCLLKALLHQPITVCSNSSSLTIFAGGGSAGLFPEPWLLQVPDPSFLLSLRYTILGALLTSNLTDNVLSPPLHMRELTWYPGPHVIRCHMSQLT